MRRRLWLFDVMVWTVMCFGVEIWGCKEWERVEGLQDRYGRWVLGLEGWTPDYMVREELKREKLILRGAGRAWRYEDRLKKGKESIWTRSV